MVGNSKNFDVDFILAFIISEGFEFSKLIIANKHTLKMCDDN